MPRKAERALLPALLALAAAAAQAQDATSTPRTLLQTQLGTSVLVSDQLSRDLRGTDGGALLTVSPGLYWRARTGALTGSVDYTLNMQTALRTVEPPHHLQNRLLANLNFEPWPETFNVAAQSQIGRQTLSAFGPQQASRLGQENVNQLEVGTASVTPRFRARLGGLALVSLSHSQQVQRTRGSSQGDLQGRTTAADLDGAQETRLQWKLQATRQISKPRLTRATLTDLARLNLEWQPDIDWRLGVSGGRERNNLASADFISGAYYGASLKWSPSPRTQVDLSSDHRLLANQFFGSLNHRMKRSVLRVSVSRAISQPGTIGLSGQQTQRDLLDAQLAASEPDPVLRRDKVDQLLRERGLSGEEVVGGGFVSSSPSLVKRGQLNWSYAIPRGTIGLTAAETHTSAIGTPVAGEDLASSTLIKQRSFGLTLGYQLTPLTVMNLTATRQDTRGDSHTLDSRLSGLDLTWAIRLGLRQHLGITVRHVEYDSVRLPYVENAFQVSLTQQF